MPLRRISSLLTVPFKFGFPALVAFGVLNLFIWGTWSPGPPDAVSAMVVYLMLLASPLLVLWIFGPAKKVLIDEANKRLYVSNYRKEITIPFTEIASVSEFIFSDPTRITIRLHSPGEFGERIVFLATYRFGGWLAGSHPIVKELRAIAASVNEGSL